MTFITWMKLHMNESFIHYVNCLVMTWQFFIVPTSYIEFMFGHGSIKKKLYKDFVHLSSGSCLVMKGSKNSIAHTYVYIYMAINCTIGQNCLVKGVF
jgi:hypothetical protein